MNLSSLLQRRAGAGRPVRVGLIGAGKFGSMFLAQVPTIPGLEVTVIADLDTERARDACRAVGWDDARLSATRFTTTGLEACTADDVEVVIEATGHPEAGIRHALSAIEAGRHIVMVNVEADVLAGPLLAARARERGTVYSMAYGDQPALVAEMVDWARPRLHGRAAGKGTKYLPLYHGVTPGRRLDPLRASPEARRRRA
jgi:predicted homoserine dehydrogenase-like protein